MISKQAVRDYLHEAKRRSDKAPIYGWLKRATFREADRLLQTKLHKDFEFTSEPYFHQAVSLYLGLYYPEYMFMLDMGLGKTKIALDIASNRMLAGQVKRCLVLVPTDVNVANWEDDALNHTGVKVIGTYGSVPEKIDQLEALPDQCIAAVTYPAFVHMCSVKIGRQLTPNPTAMDWISSWFEMIVMDEIHYAKNYETLLWQIGYDIRNAVPYAYGLTGTPLGKSALDLWAQFKLLTNEDVFPGSFELFRASFFNAVEGPYGKTSWRSRPKSTRMIRALVRTRSVRFKDSECADVPETVTQQQKIRWTDEGYGYYHNIGESSFFDHTQSQTDKALAYHQLRGLASGYLRWKDDEGKLLVLELPQNPKWEALMGILESLPNNRKLIVFYVYQYTGTMLERLVEAAGFTCVRVDGTTKKNHERIRSWQKNSGPRVLLGNCQSIGTGGNLQNTNYGVFYETTSNPIIRRQAEKRYTGARQVNFSIAHIIDLVMSGSLDQRVLDSLADDKDLFEQVVNAPEAGSELALPARVKKGVKPPRAMRSEASVRPHKSTVRVLKRKRA